MPSTHSLPPRRRCLQYVCVGSAPKLLSSVEQHPTPLQNKLAPEHPYVSLVSCNENNISTQNASSNANTRPTTTTDNDSVRGRLSLHTTIGCSLPCTNPPLHPISTPQQLSGFRVVPSDISAPSWSSGSRGQRSSPHGFNQVCKAVQTSPPPRPKRMSFVKPPLQLICLQLSLPPPLSPCESVGVPSLTSSPDNFSLTTTDPPPHLLPPSSHFALFRTSSFSSSGCSSCFSPYPNNLTDSISSEAFPLFSETTSLLSRLASIPPPRCLCLHPPLSSPSCPGPPSSHSPPSSPTCPCPPSSPSPPCPPSSPSPPCPPSSPSPPCPPSSMFSPSCSSNIWCPSIPRGPPPTSPVLRSSVTAVHPSGLPDTCSIGNLSESNDCQSVSSTLSACNSCQNLSAAVSHFASLTVTASPPQTPGGSCLSAVSPAEPEPTSQTLCSPSQQHTFPQGPTHIQPTVITGSSVSPRAQTPTSPASRSVPSHFESPPSVLNRSFSSPPFIVDTPCDAVAHPSSALSSPRFLSHHTSPSFSLSCLPTSSLDVHAPNNQTRSVKPASPLYPASDSPASERLTPLLKLRPRSTGPSGIPVPQQLSSLPFSSNCTSSGFGVPTDTVSGPVYIGPTTPRPSAQTRNLCSANSRKTLVTHAQVFSGCRLVRNTGRV
eukprot:GHVQ01004948.1.p2 GENE.GHVQ01004948.1~~GHVQ01004948.1.p2  ORF type:complete len:658 (+),score=138.46 GHVQ01004948.1:185-2158(+)